MTMEIKCQSAACQNVYQPLVKTQRRFQASFETVTCSARSIFCGVTTWAVWALGIPRQVASFWRRQNGIFRGADHFVAADFGIFFLFSSEKVLV